MAKIDWRLYVPFKRLVRLEVGDRTYRVPENNVLLRCFQFLSPNALTYANFCWNDICHTCKVRIDDGTPHGREILACQVGATDGMRLAAPPKGVRLPPPDRVEVYDGLEEGLTAVTDVDDGPAEDPPGASDAPADTPIRERS